MRDRLIRGAMAGVVGGLWVLGATLLSYYVLHFTKQTWTDVVSQLVASHRVKSAGDWVAAVGMLLIWNGMLGAVFARYVVPKQGGNYILRAVFFGLGAWFVLMSIGTLYKIPLLSRLDWQTVISNWITLAGWGVITGWLMARWDGIATKAR